MSSNRSCAEARFSTGMKPAHSRGAQRASALEREQPGEARRPQPDEPERAEAREQEREPRLRAQASAQGLRGGTTALRRGRLGAEPS